MRLLTVVDGIGPPAARGVDIIYRLQCLLASLGVEVHILTVIDFLTPPDWRKWMDMEHNRWGIHFHTIQRKTFNAAICTLLTKLDYGVKVVKLNHQLHFDIIHEYSSAPILFYRTGMYKVLLGTCTFHTLCSYNDRFMGSLRFCGGLRFLDRVICSSRHLRDTMIARGCTPDRITYLSYGVECERFQRPFDRIKLRQNWGLPLGQPVVLYVGPLEDHKGAFVFAQALAEMARKKNAIFLVVTHRRIQEMKHIENRRRFLETIAPARDRVVIIEGLVDIPSVMAVADIVVMPLKTLHGTAAQPLTLLEAMAAGKAIVASSLNGIVELLCNGETALLCRPGDAVDLGLAINRLICDSSLRERLAKGAKAKAERECDIGVIADRLKDLYQQALSS